MLINFSCNNFKSFRDGFVFNMRPEKKMKELDYSLLQEDVSGKSVDGLSVSVVYGPNAAGKTSVINAMSCMRQIVLRGSISDSEDDKTGDHVSNHFELAPFAFQSEKRPVSFNVTFTADRKKFCYSIEVFVGGFLEDTAERYITKEQLYVNDHLVFDRTEDEVKVLSLKPIKDDLNIGYDMHESEKTRITMSNNITKDSLLLLTDFNSFCSKTIVKIIKEWFSDQFTVVNSSDRIRFYPGMPDIEGKPLVNRYVNSLAREAGIIGTDLAYINDPETHTTKLISVFEDAKGDSYGLDADSVESVGTMRLITIMPVIVSAMRRGGVLVIDELDASLHPMIVMNLISIFHNDSVNKNRAQLIFNTHNPIYLNHDLLRRDEIKFVERDKESKSSSLYALSDFKANGEASVRKTSDYMRNYFVNRYGAIEDIDFTDIIAELLEKDD